MKRGHIFIGNYEFHAHRYIKSIVYGGLDGIITTFAIVAGVAGAALSANIVLILGFANLIADGFSMAAGDYLSSKADKEYKKNRRVVDRRGPIKNGIVTFISFSLFGFIPLLAYVVDIFLPLQNTFYVSVVLTAIALFFLGIFKFRITAKHWFLSGVEMLLVGGIAAVAAYVIGHFVAGLV